MLMTLFKNLNIPGFFVVWGEVSGRKEQQQQQQKTPATKKLYRW